MYAAYIYISAEASMASRRVDARPPILKTLSSPQSGEAFPLPLPMLNNCPRPGMLHEQPWGRFTPPLPSPCRHVHIYAYDTCA